MKISRAFLKTPIATLEISSDEIGICAINLAKNVEICAIKDKNLRFCVEQLDEYFKGNLQKFDLNLHIIASDFQQLVYGALSEIPYAKSATYAHIAKQINRPNAFRAVANAISKNKIPIIIPCHRVISANNIGGYSFCGLKNAIYIKKFLLEMEAQMPKFRYTNRY